MALPGFLTNGEMAFAVGSFLAKDLGMLVSYRNWLLHLEEYPVTASGADPRIKINLGNDQPEIDVTKLLPKDPWDQVTLSLVNKFRDAVGVYISEVIEPERIKPGQLVR